MPGLGGGQLMVVLNTFLYLSYAMSLMVVASLNNSHLQLILPVGILFSVQYSSKLFAELLMSILKKYKLNATCKAEMMCNATLHAIGWHLKSSNSFSLIGYTPKS